MKEKIEQKLADIANAIMLKDPRAITKDEYSILTAELQRITEKPEPRKTTTTTVKKENVK